MWVNSFMKHSLNFLFISSLIFLQGLKFTSTEQKLGLLADAVIETIARLEFEDGLRTEVFHGGCWQPCGVRTWPKTKSNPPPHQVGSYSKFGCLMAFVESL